MIEPGRSSTAAHRVFLLLALILAVAFAVPTALSTAQEMSDGGTEEIEVLESIEDFEIVEAEPPPGLPELAGRLHPAMVHFPIGWITLVLLLDLAAFVLGRRELETAGLWALVLGVVGFVPAMTTGFLRAGHLTVSPGIYHPVETHRNLAILVLLICIDALITRWIMRKNFTGAVRWIYLGMIAAATVLIGLVGHLGGKMVYGENFLPF